MQSLAPMPTLPSPTIHFPLSVSIGTFCWTMKSTGNSRKRIRVTMANPDVGDYDPIGVVDYCCYITSFKQNDRRIRAALWTLGCKGYNVKLLKIHGSLNWLQCMNCQRLFTGFKGKTCSVGISWLALPALPTARFRCDRSQRFDHAHVPEGSFQLSNQARLAKCECGVDGGAQDRLHRLLVARCRF